MELDTQVKVYLRDQFAIASVRYYMVPGRIGWAAISKSVENEMSEKSINRLKEPHFFLGDIYPQGSKGAGFAIAMLDKATLLNEEDLIGIYVLKAPESAK